MFRYGAEWFGPMPVEEPSMSSRFETAQRVALSAFAALFFAAVAISAAAPVLPVA